MSKSSILLVEDHAGFARALQTMLGQIPNILIAAVADSGESALQYLRESKVDLVLVDYSLPDTSGVALVESVLAAYPEQMCAMLSGHLSLQHARRALEVGARGYMIKDNPLGILNGLPRILKGEIYISEEVRGLGSSDLLAGFS
jgi:DNA-binding NarL/FixJ family response regulator